MNRFTYLRSKTKFEMLHAFVKIYSIVAIPFICLTPQFIDRTIYKKHGFVIILCNILLSIVFNDYYHVVIY